MLDWFKHLSNKTRLNFLQLDIINFYPSISEDLFNTALKFASETVSIDNQDIKILQNARQSLLFHNNDVWKKNSGTFDVTMGAYDGAEVCKLVGLYILHLMVKKSTLVCTATTV